VLYTSLVMLTPVADQTSFQSASDQSLLVRFGQEITPEAHERVRKLLWLLQSKPVRGIRNLHPAYTSLLVKFDALTLQQQELEALLRQYLEGLDDLRLPEPRLVEIPVCYGGDFGRDLDDVSSMHGITPSQVIELHASALYVVCFLGFVPGFAYLGGLPNELATPRLAAPRPSVAAGSVAIAGHQAGVYPFATPGGWRLIGRTPVAMFQPDRSDMSLLSVGDRVRFAPISRERFAALETTGR
jgi:KipI family sensor histidine kinase inhibitor